jgi:hypothetical protein
VEIAMTSSFELWQKLPTGFLKRKYRGWCQLDYDLQCLIVALAEKQRFKCALCSQTKGLEIEHDHDPEFGPGDQRTIYNIRGLACRKCNWLIMMFEAEERGEYVHWENLSFKLDDSRYWSYIDSYETRSYPLIQAALKAKLGGWNYWRRRILLSKFDGWKEWPHDYPWHWGFEEIKEKRHGKIRTAGQFLKALVACVKFLADKVREDPDYRHSAEFLRCMAQLEPIMDTLRPIIEPRLMELGHKLPDLSRVEPAN